MRGHLFLTLSYQYLQETPILKFWKYQCAFKSIYFIINKLVKMEMINQLNCCN